MEKIKYKKTGRHKNERIGTPTGLLNRNGDEIKTGDFIRMHGKYTYDGIVLWNREDESYGLHFGFWYGDNQYDSDCYGKYIRINSDNGMKMELEPLSSLDPHANYYHSKEEPENDH